MTDRKMLIALLKKLEPAVSTKDLLPVLACFCFEEDRAHAYDDVVALRFPMKTGINGAVRGRVLLDWLNASRAKEVEITQADAKLTIKAGRAKLETSVLPTGDFLFTSPDMKKAREITVDVKFMEMLTKVALAMGRDPSSPWRLGVVLAFSDAGMILYASDNKTAARGIIGKPDGDLKVAMLPPRFVELLVDKGKADPVSKLYLAKEWAEARFQSGLRLFCRTVAGADLTNFVQLFESIDGMKPSKAPIPKGLDRCLERACVVAPFSKDPLTTLTVAGGKLKLETLSPAGDIRDSLAFEGHEDITVAVPPEALTRALAHAEHIDVLEQCVRFTGGKYTYLVSTIQNETAKQPTTDGEE